MAGSSAGDIYLLFRLKFSTKAGANEPVQQNDSKTIEISLTPADKRNDAKSFKFVDGRSGDSGNGTFKYYVDSEDYPEHGDCYVQVWELDKWDPESRRKQFDQWYKAEDEDVGERGDKKNNLCAVFRGFIAKVPSTSGQKKTWKYEFICTDDADVPTPESDNQASITIRYRKSGEKEMQEKDILIAGEVESRWELGVYPASAKSEKTWESQSYTYPIFFVDSLKNLIRNQLKEGGLTAGCYANLNHDEDEQSVRRYDFYQRKLNEQIEQGITAAENFLKPLRQSAVQKRQQLGLQSLTDEKAVWESVQEELEWQGAQAKFQLRIRDSYSRNTFSAKYRAWVKGGKAGAKPDVGFQNTNKNFSFDDWLQKIVPEALPKLQAVTSGTNALPFFEDAYGVGNAGMVAPAERNKGNICRELDLDAIESQEPEDLKTQIVSKKKIMDVFNDREFSRNSAELAQEFGFLSLDDDGEIAKGTHPLESFNEIPTYLHDLCEKVESDYPALFKGKTKARIYRLVIFTHGDRHFGIKTPAAWLQLKDLESSVGKALVASLTKVLAPRAVITLYACSTGGNFPVDTAHRSRYKASVFQDIQKQLKTSYDSGEVKEESSQQTGASGKAPADYKEALKEKNKELEAEWRALKEYNFNLINNGGNPESSSPFRNLLGAGSFAEKLRSVLKEAGIAADVWSHTDPGHTSRNSRLRLFTADGGVYDLVRLIFEESADFEENNEPSERQLLWWFGRGGENAPLEHQHAVKKAALCPYGSLNDEARPFSLKNIIEDFRQWYKDARSAKSSGK